MNPRIDAANKLKALTAKLETTSKPQVLREILGLFPYLYGYWKQLMECEAFSSKNVVDMLQACPSLDMVKYVLSTPFCEDPEVRNVSMRLIGFHYHAAPIWEQVYERDPSNLYSLKSATEMPLYDYARIYQLAYVDKVVDEDTLVEKSASISKDVHSLWQFESKLKRSYFHVLDIDEDEREIWMKYLKHTEKLGDVTRTWQLYQRCLIVTALYPEFWLLWLRWILSEEENITRSLGVDIGKVMKLALHYHPSDRDICIVNSRYLEQTGSTAQARSLLTDDVVELFQFDERNHLLNSSQHKSPQDQLSPVILFKAESIEPRSLFQLWKNGLCPNPAHYAKMLRDAGCVYEFFEVDKTLGYYDES